MLGFFHIAGSPVHSSVASYHTAMQVSTNPPMHACHGYVKAMFGKPCLSSAGVLGVRPNARQMPIKLQKRNVGLTVTVPLAWAFAFTLHTRNGSGYNSTAGVTYQ